MLHDQALVAEDGDAGDGVQVLLVEEVDQLRDVVDVDLVAAQQRVFEGYVDAAVGVFDVEDYGVAADFTPVADDAQAMIARCHDAGQVDGADFEVFGDWDRLLCDWSGEDAGDDDVFVGFQDVGGAVAINVADGVGQFGRGQV